MTPSKTNGELVQFRLDAADKDIEALTQKLEKFDTKVDSLVVGQEVLKDQVGEIKSLLEKRSLFNVPWWVKALGVVVVVGILGLGVAFGLVWNHDLAVDIIQKIPSVSFNK